MSHIIIVVLVILTIVLYKALVNSIKLIRCKKMYSEYLAWCQNPSECFLQKRQEILTLFKDANVKDIHLIKETPKGENILRSAVVTVTTTFPSYIPAEKQATIRMFNEAIGTYKSRLINSFNPLYWIDLVLFAPKHLLDYLNVDSEKVIYKLVVIFGTALMWCIEILIGIFSNEIGTFIKNLF